MLKASDQPNLMLLGVRSFCEAEKDFLRGTSFVAPLLHRRGGGGRGDGGDVGGY